MQVRLYTEFPEILPYLFPTFVPVHDFIDRGVDSSVKKVIVYQAGHESSATLNSMLSLRFVEYILVLTSPEYIDEEDMLFLETFPEVFEAVTAAADLPPRPSYVERLAKSSRDDQLEFMKTSMALGRWYREFFTQRGKVYNVFEGMTKSTKAMVESWYVEKKKTSPHVMFSSILSFLARVKQYQTEKHKIGSEIMAGWSDWYRKIIRRGGRQFMGTKGVKALQLDVPIECRYLFFLLLLRCK